MMVARTFSDLLFRFSKRRSAKANCASRLRSQGPTSCRNSIAKAHLELGTFPCKNNVAEKSGRCYNRILRSTFQKQVCDDRALRSASLFSFGRCIDYVPTNCFMGTEKRIEAKCSKVKECCPALSRQSDYGPCRRNPCETPIVHWLILIQATLHAVKQYLGEDLKIRTVSIPSMTPESY
ncbi:unnamed protein product [Heligmosomoides polygyrus]|uniref:Carboxypeptidase inhibitor n=1 Tax=Heligmosomoides polygyrus TaxID=6339 RepID=A0A183G3S6_HELPZ|nr:unnamed protein product [Heligmosomoides polygyrus]